MGITTWLLLVTILTSHTSSKPHSLSRREQVLQQLMRRMEFDETFLDAEERSAASGSGGGGSGSEEWGSGYGGGNGNKKTTTTTQAPPPTPSPTPRPRCPEEPVILTEPSGYIRSPWYSDGEYPAHASCAWILQAPEGMNIQFDVSDLDIFSNGAVINLYDGPDSSFPRVLVNMTGYTLSGPEYYDGSYRFFTGNTALLTFHSDWFPLGDGFEIFYSFTNDEKSGDPCKEGGVAEFHEAKGHITSLMYSAGKNSVRDVDCTYRIEAPPGKKIKLTSLEFELDEYISWPTCSLLYAASKLDVGSFMQVYDGPDLQTPADTPFYCGSHSPDGVISTSNVMFIHLHFGSGGSNLPCRYNLEYEWID